MAFSSRPSNYVTGCPFDRVACAYVSSYELPVTDLHPPMRAIRVAMDAAPCFGIYLQGKLKAMLEVPI